jgi:predicted metal-binding transcription factor (methanogenesis marker protein 9)
MTAVQKPMSNIQLELLKVFSTNISDEEVLEIKQILAEYFMNKAINEADKIAKERGYTAETMREWLNDENQ